MGFGQLSGISLPAIQDAGCQQGFAGLMPDSDTVVIVLHFLLPSNTADRYMSSSKSQCTSVTRRPCNSQSIRAAYRATGLERLIAEDTEVRHEDHCGTKLVIQAGIDGVSRPQVRSVNCPNVGMDIAFHGSKDPSLRQYNFVPGVASWTSVRTVQWRACQQPLWWSRQC